MKNRSLQVRVVKTDPTTGDAAESPSLSVEQINAIASAQLQNVAKTIGALILVKKGADTLSELMLIAGRKYI